MSAAPAAADTPERAAHKLYAAIEETAALLDVRVDPATTRPIVTAFQDHLAQAAILFRSATDQRHAGELNLHLMMLPGDRDPYALLHAKGLAEKSDHPSSRLLAEVADRFPVASYGIDFGVVGGFQKTWSCFPTDDMQRLSEIADLPSAPRAVADNLAFFARYGLDKHVTLIGIDYAQRTMNLYFGEVESLLQRDAARAMLREMDMPEPSEALLHFAERAFGFYVTLTWDSPRIQRFCYAAIAVDPTTVLAHPEPEIERFLSTVPYGHDTPKAVYAALSPKDGGEYYKIQTYYQWRPRLTSHMHATVADAGR
ncbi:aromatic prenyltransferase [Streptomyces sp. NPDC048182]|uniref:aromatic prenyltransferase n=1 Tax=Streptomyces sp. NPDC048182 TaxID=3365507 RepID=UPI00372206BD